MTVVVSFTTPKGIGSIHAPGVGNARIRENLALDGTSTATVSEGEMIVVGNAELSMIAVAFGTTPNAAATAATALTSAGIPVPAGAVMAFMPATGSKISVKALS